MNAPDMLRNVADGLPHAHPERPGLLRAAELLRHELEAQDLADEVRRLHHDVLLPAVQAMPLDALNHLRHELDDFANTAASTYEERTS